MLVGTNYVVADEPCFAITEIDGMSPKGQMHRYRKIMVVRNGRIAEYVEDMGLAKKQKHNQCRIMGGCVDEHSGRIFIEHTVAELREIAETMKVGNRN